MEFFLLKCWSCDQKFYTQNEMSTHHLDAHERALVLRESDAVLDDADFPPLDRRPGQALDLGPMWDGTLEEDPPCPST